jgi:hypothetical protein
VEAAGVEPGASRPHALLTCFTAYTYHVAFAVCATRVPFEELGGWLPPHPRGKRDWCPRMGTF